MTNGPLTPPDNPTPQPNTAPPPIIGPFPVGIDPAVLAAAVAGAQRQGLPYGTGPAFAIPQIGLAQIQLWQGQFPPPDAVERYNTVLPGSFDRMIAMAESAQAIQAADTKRAQEYLHADIQSGQWLGAGTTALAMLGAFGCVVVAAMFHSTGAYYVAGVFLGVPVMAVGKSLVESARSSKTDTAAPQAASQPAQTAA